MEAVNMDMPKKLAAKLAKILGEVEKVPKTGHNSYHNYDYVTENDLVYAVRKRLADSSIFVFTSVEDQQVQIIEDGPRDNPKRSALTTVTTKHTFVDGDSGEIFSVFSKGQGADVGDKGGYKAITGAMKYFLYKCFMIPTGDDPEGDERTDQRAGGQREPATQEARGQTPTRSTDRAAETRREPASVPREAAASLTEREKFRSGAWQKVVIHFGKNKGTLLGSLEDRSLRWYAKEWQPKPYDGKISFADQTLRAALDAFLDDDAARSH